MRALRTVAISSVLFTLALVASAQAAPVPAAPAAMAPKPAVTWDQFPPAVKATIQKEIGALPIMDKLSKKPDKDGKMEYGAGADVGKKNIKVKVAENGMLIQRREKEDIGPAGVPKLIEKAAKKELGKSPILTAAKLTKDAEVSYQMTAETKDRTLELTLAGDGSFMGKTEAKKKADQTTTTTTTTTPPGGAKK